MLLALVQRRNGVIEVFRSLAMMDITVEVPNGLVSRWVHEVCTVAQREVCRCRRGQGRNGCQQGQTSHVYSCDVWFGFRLYEVRTSPRNVCMVRSCRGM